MSAFTVTLNASDITDSVLEARWQIGLAAPDDSVSRASGTLTLRDADNALLPTLTPGTSVSIAHDGDPLFTGRVGHVRVPLGSLADPVLSVLLLGHDALLRREIIHTPVASDIRSGDALAAVMDATSLAALSRDFDLGAETFTTLADAWGDGIRGWNALAQIADAERGLLLFDRAGNPVFRDRHSLRKSPEIAATLDDDALTMNARFGAGLVNQISIRLRPRRLGLTVETLWTLGSSQPIRPTSFITLRARLSDASGRRAGAATLIPPVAVTDFSANTEPDGSGLDRTSDVTLSIIGTDGGSARLKAENASADRVYLLAGATLRGIPVLSGGGAQIEAEDASSLSAHGLHALALNLPLLDRLSHARDLATDMLRQQASPALRAEALSPPDGLTLTLFDAIAINDPRTGHDAAYRIVGEQHVLSDGGHVHQTTWTLRQVDPDPVWVLDAAALESETWLGV
jgi:hypothetical protein